MAEQNPLQPVSQLSCGKRTLGLGPWKRWLPHCGSSGVWMAGSARSVAEVSGAFAPDGVVGTQQTSADDDVDEWNLHSSKRLLGFQR